MKVIEKDPRVPLRSYLLTSEREADMDRQVAEAVVVQVSRLNLDKVPEEYRNALALQIKAEAVKVLEKIHDGWMRARLAQWQTTCRFDGCEKQPRVGRSSKGTNTSKNHRRTFVFCPGHAGVRNEIAKADYRRLKSNANLRVVAE